MPFFLQPAPRPRLTAKGRRGFTLVEAVISCFVAALMMGAITFAYGTLFSSQAQPSVGYNGSTFNQAPSFRDFRQALQLHFALSQAVDAADAVLVFGGSGSHPSLDPVGPSTVLATDFVPTSLTAMNGGDIASQFSSWAQRTVDGAQFSGKLVAAGSSADFTVLTVQGGYRVTSITQQRRYSSTWIGKNIELYEVTIQVIDWQTGSAVLTTNPDTGTTPTYAYRVFYRDLEDVWRMPPGAIHQWFRYDTVWNRVEEGPCTVVFADPHVLAGDTTAQISPMSRFIYLLPVVQ